MPGGAVIGALRAGLSLDTAAFEAGAKRAQATMGSIERRMDRHGRKLQAAGRRATVALTAPLVAFATIALKTSLTVIDSQAKMAQSFSTTVVSMQVLTRAADLAGVSFGEVQQAGIQLTKRLSEVAATGKGPAADALKQLRLHAIDLQRVPLDQRISLIQDALHKFVPEAERAAVATGLFGSRAGLTFTRIDSATLRTATTDVTRFGVAVSEVDAEQIERTNDAISRLGLAGRGLANQISVSLAPTLERISNGAAEVAAWFNQLSDRTKKYISVALTLAAAIGPVAFGLGVVLRIGAKLGVSFVALVAKSTVVTAGLASIASVAGPVAENIDTIAVAAGALALTKLPVLAARAYKTVTAFSLMNAQMIAGIVAARGMAVASSLVAVGMNAIPVVAFIGIATSIYAGFKQSRLAAEDYAEAVKGVASAHDLLSVATDTFYRNMTAKNAEAMRRAAEQARDATRAALEAARAELEAASFMTNFFGANFYETNRMTEAMSDIKALSGALATAEARLDAASVAAARTAGETGKAAANISTAADVSQALANGLGVASGQASMLSSYLSGLPGALAGAQTNIAGLQAGLAVLDGGGNQAAANVAKYRAELETTLPPMQQMHEVQRRLLQGSINQRVTLYEREQDLRAEYQRQVSALGKVKSAGGAASASALGNLLQQINQRKTLLGLTDDQRKKYQAVLSVQQRLGKEAGKYSKARIDALAHELVSLDATEAALQRVSDRQQQWSENITRTAFENGSLSDTTEGVLKDIAFQFAHSKVVLPVVASVTSILGLDQLIGGGGQALGAVGGGSGTNLLGSLLGNVGSSLLGGGSVLGGIGTGLGGVLSGGGLGSSFANLGGLVSGVSGGLGAIGAALPAIGLVLGGIYALSKAFSRKYAGTAIRGSLGAGGFTGDQFDFYKGGALRSNKETHKPLAAELQAMLDTTMMGVSKGLTGMALSLGLGTAALADFNDEQFTLWTHGKDAAQIQQELQVQIAATSDEMAALILNTEQFSRTGEGASDTLSRLSGGLLAVNDMADLLGRTAFAVSLGSADAASNLVDVFGGLEAMSGTVNTYWAAFYSDAERSDTTLRRLSDTFADLGVTMPQSRDGFRDLVTGMDLTTESGRQMYAQVLQLSGAMDQVLPKVGQFTAAMSGLLDRIGGQIGVQIDAARGLASDSKSAASLWYRTATTLRSFLGDLIKSDLTAASRGQIGALNQSRFQSAFQMARGGDIDAARGIPALAKSYLTSIKATAGTDLDYRRMAAQVQGQVKFLAGIAELEGANKDVLQTLYEQQIEVLTGLGNFLQLEGLTGVQIEGLDQSIQDMAANWDGTVATFDTSLTSLEGAIREAELFSYDYLKQRLKVAVDLLPSATIPAYLQELIGRAESGITASIDFIVRSDLAAPMKWLAVNSASEHIKSLDFILRNDLGSETRRLALASGSELRRGIRLSITGDIDAETRRIALASSSELSRLVNVALNRGGETGTAVQVLRQIHDGARSFSRELRASVDLSALTAGQAAFVESLGGASSGRVTLAGGFTFAPEGAFQTWFSGTTRAHIVAPMLLLRENLDQLREAVNQDRWARHNAAEKQRQIGVITAAAAGVSGSLADNQQWAVNLVAKVEALQLQTGTQLRLGNGAGVLGLNRDGSINYNADGVMGGDVAAFGAQFWGQGGLQDYMARANVNIGSSGAQLEAYRARVTALGGIPAFAMGTSFAPGGSALVGELGPEVVDLPRGSTVHPYSASKSMLDNSAVVAELRRLNTRLARMEAQDRQIGVASIRHQKDTARSLKVFEVERREAEQTA